MGNYFRQIYTGSSAEWWTLTLTGCRGAAGVGGSGGGGAGGSVLIGVSLDWVVVGGCVGRGERRGLKAMEASWWRKRMVM